MKAEIKKIVVTPADTPGFGLKYTVEYRAAGGVSMISGFAKNERAVFRDVRRRLRRWKRLSA